MVAPKLTSSLCIPGLFSSRKNGERKAAKATMTDTVKKGREAVGAILEDPFALLAVNATYVKAASGRRESRGTSNIPIDTALSSLITSVSWRDRPGLTR
jgi:hypothetical protein